MSISSILINTDTEKIKDEKQFIISNDAFFNVHFREYKLDKIDYDAIDRIDEITAVKGSAITTQYGELIVDDIYKDTEQLVHKYRSKNVEKFAKHLYKYFTEKTPFATANKCFMRAVVGETLLILLVM